MTALPESVIKAWEDREGPVVLTTIDASGTPNAIYATCVSLYNPETLVVADNYFDKTRRNIKAGSKGSFLFITNERKAYQIKGTIEYFTSGPVFDEMKKWNSPKLPGLAVAALVVKEVYSGSQKVE